MTPGGGHSSLWFSLAMGLPIPRRLIIGYVYNKKKVEISIIEKVNFEK